MRLSKECRHALSILAHFAHEPRGTIVASADLARILAIPRPFLSKILQRLSAAGFLAGHRGAVRGYALARRGREINVRDVALALDGADLFSRCIFWSDRCSDEKPCPLHAQWVRARPQIERDLAALTIDNLETTPTNQKSRANPRTLRRRR